jgi:hypothetical protein
MEAGVREALVLLRDEEQLERMSQQAIAFAAEHRGAAKRMARAIVELLDQTPGAPRSGEGD